MTIKLSFLEATIPLTKTFTKDANGELKKISHPRIMDYQSHVEDVGEDLVLMYGAMKFHGDLGHCLLKGNLSRELHWESRAGTTNPNAPTRWACFDLDGTKSIEKPQGFMELINFGNVSCIHQFSSSSGIVPGRGLSAHIFALIDREMSPEQLKCHLMYWNLNTPQLRCDIGLARTGNALRWPLDLTTCQNDKLIYIAPPILEEGVEDGFKGERIALMLKDKPMLTFGDTPALAKVKAMAHELHMELRAKAGLPVKKSWNFKNHGTVEVLANPDPATINGIKHERGFTYLNLNDGDSWGYYHPDNNADVIYNWKGEPNYPTAKLLPSYYLEAKAKAIDAPSSDIGGLHVLAFRDFDTSDYWNGTYDEKTGELDIAKAKSSEQLRDFLVLHRRPVPEAVPIWRFFYDPEQHQIIDVPQKRLNSYQPSLFAKRKLEPASEVPPTWKHCFQHVLNDRGEIYERWLNWMASKMQFRVNLGTSWVWHGNQGTGKGLILERCLRPLLGHFNVEAIRMRLLDSQFNSFFKRNLIVWVDEAEQGSFREGAALMSADMKNFATEPWIQIREMHKDPRQMRNYQDMILVGNKGHIISIDANGDRRFSIAIFQPERLFPTGEAGRARAVEYVGLLEQEQWQLYCYFMNYKADRELAREPINTSAKETMIALSSNSIEGVARSLANGDLQFLQDQKPRPEDLKKKPRFEHERAENYVKLVDQIAAGELDSGLSREEVQTLFQYIVGGAPEAPGKFTQYLVHHGINLVPVRRGTEVFKGVKITWKRPG